MSLVKILERYNKGYIFNIPDKTFPTFINETKVMNCLTSVVKENKRTLIYGDYDIDGVSCREIAKMVLSYLGHTNFEVFQYSSRTHQVDSAAFNQALHGKFECMIICDAGSSDPLSLKRLVSQGVEVVVLDHHESVFGYEDFGGVNIINTSFDNRVRSKDIVVSAGALTYIVFAKLCEALGVPPLKSTSALALTSLYGDSIDMTGDLQRSIYYEATSLKPSELPVLLQRFIYPITEDNNSSNRRVTPKEFTRRYLEFTVNPRINSLIRSENFHLLNKLLDWTPSSGVDVRDLVIETIDSHRTIRKELSKAADLLNVEKYDTLVVGNLSSVVGLVGIPADKLANYTGLVATELTNKYKRMAVVIADTGSDIKGSVRDPLGRDYLSIFKNFSASNGHNAAFGFSMPYIELQDFLGYVEMVDSQKLVGAHNNSPIILPHNLPTPDKDLLEEACMYNEFSGNTCPKAYFSKIWLSTKAGDMLPFGLKYTWGDISILTNTFTPIRPGSILQLFPYKGFKTSKNNGNNFSLEKIG